MQNISLKIDGNLLIATIDLSKKVGATKKGNAIIAQTEGYMGEVKRIKSLNKEIMIKVYVGETASKEIDEL